MLCVRIKTLTNSLTIAAYSQNQGAVRLIFMLCMQRFIYGLATKFYLLFIYSLVLYEAEKPASKVCGQPVPTARKYSVHT